MTTPLAMAPRADRSRPEEYGKRQNRLRIFRPIGIVRIGRRLHASPRLQGSHHGAAVDVVRSLTCFSSVKPTQIWPDLLYIVRHGESAGNVARDAALEAGHPDHRHRACATSTFRSRELGREAGGSARAVVRRRCRRRSGRTSCSPRPISARARPRGSSSKAAGMTRTTPTRWSSTSGCARRSSASSTGSPRIGIRERLPEQAEFRRLLGKFYHRPPGGESWCDVILRLRSATEMIVARILRRARADRLPRGGRSVHALPARAHDRGASFWRSTRRKTSPTARLRSTSTTPSSDPAAIFVSSGSISSPRSRRPERRSPPSPTPMSARARKRAIAVTPALLRRWPLPRPGEEADKDSARRGAGHRRGGGDSGRAPSRRGRRAARRRGQAADRGPGKRQCRARRRDSRSEGFLVAEISGGHLEQQRRPARRRATRRAPTRYWSAPE